METESMDKRKVKSLKRSEEIVESSLPEPPIPAQRVSLHDLPSHVLQKIFIQANLTTPISRALLSSTNSALYASVAIQGERADIRFARFIDTIVDSNELGKYVKHLKLSFRRHLRRDTTGGTTFAPVQLRHFFGKLERLHGLNISVFTNLSSFILSPFPVLDGTPFQSLVRLTLYMPFSRDQPEPDLSRILTRDRFPCLAHFDYRFQTTHKRIGSIPTAVVIKPGMASITKLELEGDISFSDTMLHLIQSLPNLVDITLIDDCDPSELRDHILALPTTLQHLHLRQGVGYHDNLGGTASQPIDFLVGRFPSLLCLNLDKPFYSSATLFESLELSDILLNNLTLHLNESFDLADLEAWIDASGTADNLETLNLMVGDATCGATVFEFVLPRWPEKCSYDALVEAVDDWQYDGIEIKGDVWYAPHVEQTYRAKLGIDSVDEDDADDEDDEDDEDGKGDAEERDIAEEEDEKDEEDEGKFHNLSEAGAGREDEVLQASANLDTASMMADTANSSCQLPGQSGLDTPCPSRGRLIALPAEILGQIFKMARDPQHDIDPRRVPICRSLLPYTRPALYCSVRIKSYEKLEAFCRGVISNASLGALVHNLVISLSGASTSSMIPSSEDIVHMFSRVVNVRYLSLSGSNRLARLVLSPTVASRSFRRMGILELTRVFGGRAKLDLTPFHFLESYPALDEFCLFIGTPVDQRDEPFHHNNCLASLLPVADTNLKVTRLGLRGEIVTPEDTAALVALFQDLDEFEYFPSDASDARSVLRDTPRSLLRLHVLPVVARSGPLDSLFLEFRFLTYLYIGGGCFSDGLFASLHTLADLGTLGFGPEADVNAALLMSLIKDGPNKVSSLTTIVLDVTGVALEGEKMADHDFNPNFTGGIGPDLWPGWLLPYWPPRFRLCEAKRFIVKAQGMGITVGGAIHQAIRVDELFEEEMIEFDEWTAEAGYW